MESDIKYPRYLAFTALLLLLSGCSGSFTGSLEDEDLDLFHWFD